MYEIKPGTFIDVSQILSLSIRYPNKAVLKKDYFGVAIDMHANGRGYAPYYEIEADSYEDAVEKSRALNRLSKAANVISVIWQDEMHGRVEGGYYDGVLVEVSYKKYRDHGHEYVISLCCQPAWINISGLNMESAKQRFQDWLGADHG